MKINQLPHMTEPTYANYSTALPELVLLLNDTMAPAKMPEIISQGLLQDLHTNAQSHCIELRMELMLLADAGVCSSERQNMQHTWCILNTLLDTAWGYTQQHPELIAAYQPVLDALLQVYNYLNEHYKHLYPAGGKMPQVVVGKVIAVMKAGYYKLLAAHNNNGLLKAVLHPIWQVIKHTAKNNNTYHRVMYAYDLLARVKWWHHAKGNYDRLYSIAISMNINSPEFLQYINTAGKSALAIYTDLRGKKLLLKNWFNQYGEELWINNQNSTLKGYDPEQPSLATWISSWLHEQEEILKLLPDNTDDLERLEITNDLAFLCWHTKIAVENGFYKTNVVKEVIQALARIISTDNTASPSLHTLERQIKGTEIDFQTKDELKRYYANCMKYLFKIPEKGVRPVASKPKAKKTVMAKPKPKARRKL